MRTRIAARVVAARSVDVDVRPHVAIEASFIPIHVFQRGAMRLETALDDQRLRQSGIQTRAVVAKPYPYLGGRAVDHVGYFNAGYLNTRKSEGQGIGEPFPGDLLRSQRQL